MFDHLIIAVCIFNTAGWIRTSTATILSRLSLPLDYCGVYKARF